MARLRPLLSALLVIAAACTGSTSSSPTEGPDPGRPAPAPPPSSRGEEMPGTGRIVAVRGEAEIVVFDPAGGAGSVVNDPRATQLARQPVWSPDGSRIAWAAVDGAGRTSVRWTGVDDASVEIAETSSLAFYLLFVDGGDGLAWLGNASGGVGLSLSDPAAGTTRLLDVDAPYYLDVLADGPLVAHVGGAELRTVNGGDPQRIGAGTPAMQAPQVAPDGTIIALLDDRGDVTIAEPGPGPVPVRSEAAPLRLVRLSRTGDEVAELARLPREALAFDLADTGDRLAIWRRDLRVGTAVEIVDVSTGEIRTVVDDGGVAAAWSPDGTRLAVLLIEAEGLARWVFWSEDGVERAASFRPTQTFVRDYLPFWDQYVRSATPWSPDSTAVTHAAVGDDGGEVLVQPADGSAATVLGAGDMSWWSSSGRSPSTPVRP